MTTSIHAKSFIAIFVALAIAPVATAAASVREPVTAGYYSASANEPASTGSVTALSSDSNAINQPASTGSSTGSVTALSSDSNPGGLVALRRDGSKAEPFVADVSSEPVATGDGFDWGDAAIGAGAGLLAACLAMFGASAMHDRRNRTSQPTRAASQSA
jgi:hypothetical protein